MQPNLGNPVSCGLSLGFGQALIWFVLFLVRRRYYRASRDDQAS